MKNFLVVIVMSFTSVAFAQDEETRDVSSFSGVKASEGVDVYLKKGDKESVKVVAGGTKASNVITEVSGAYLKVHMKDGNYRGRSDVKVFVTYVKVNKLSAASAGNIFSDETLRGADMEISALSAGTIEVTVDVGTLEVNASSAGNVEVRGKAETVIIEAASAGEVDADELEGQNVEVEANSAGSAKVYAVKSIQARASTAGSIRWRGSPDRQNNSSSTGGTVKRSS